MDEKLGPKRTYLRIPVNISAKIFTKGRFLKNVRLFDLSIAGTSFAIKQTDQIPEVFELRFRLSQFSNLIKIQVQTKNRFEKSGKLRIGCIFLGISKTNQQVLDKYICKSVDISTPSALVSTAASLCLIDAAVRIFIYFVIFHYQTSVLGNPLSFISLHNPKSIILFAYALTSSLSFLLSGRIKNTKDKLRFFTSVTLLVPGLIFLILKQITYLCAGTWHIDHLLIKAILGLQAFLIFLLGCAVLTSLASFGKINIALAILAQHQSHLKPLVNPKKVKKEKEFHEQE